MSGGAEVRNSKFRHIPRLSAITLFYLTKFHFAVRHALECSGLFSYLLGEELGEQPAQAEGAKTPQWDALAGTRLVLAVRYAGGKIPRVLEPPSLLLDILAAGGEHTFEVEASSCIVPAMPERAMTQYRQVHSSLSNLRLTHSSQSSLASPSAVGTSIRAGSSSARWHRTSSRQISCPNSKAVLIEAFSVVCF